MFLQLEKAFSKKNYKNKIKNSTPRTLFMHEMCDVGIYIRKMADFRTLQLVKSFVVKMYTGRQPGCLNFFSQIPLNIL